MSGFVDIGGAFMNALLADPPVANGKVTRARGRTVSTEDAVAIAVRLESGVPTPFALIGAPVDWTTRVAVDIYGRGTDEDLDSYLKEVYARIKADTTLGGLVSDIGEPALLWDFQTWADEMACVTLTYEVLHRTNGGTLES